MAFRPAALNLGRYNEALSFPQGSVLSGSAMFRLQVKKDGIVQKFRLTDPAIRKDDLRLTWLEAGSGSDL